MAEETKTTSTPPPISNTDLALERTVLAHERTLMAWVRTAASLISFGFTLYKIFQELGKEGNAHLIFTPRRVGMIMIFFGFLGLLLAQIQHQRSMKRLRKSYPAAPKSVAAVLGILVLLFGLAMFLGALFRQ